MVNVVLDSDFLSSFLKIAALHRVREVFGSETLLVPTAVYRELAVTDLLPHLTSTDWLEVRQVPEGAVETASRTASSEYDDLGAGEREAIALARHLDSSVLLMNDKKALRCAGKLGVQVVNVPAFLLLYRSLGDEAASEVRSLVEALEQKDHYAFSEEIRARLLAGDH
ncbi:MAG: hypothetical protein PVG07_01965 [Acidobacteriota bacterium]|jgi:predicted nucleic acid-binding protein